MSDNGYAPTGAIEGIFHSALAADNQRRLEMYRRMWLFYLGRHWTYTRDPGDPTITINYSRRVVDILTDFTFKKGFKSIVPDDPSTPGNETEEREFITFKLNETWRRNQLPLWLIEAGQAGGVTGDLFIRASWELDDPLEDPYVRLDIIPGHLVFPEFGGPSGTDRKKLKKVMILTPIYIDNPDQPRQGGVFVTRTVKQPSNQRLVILGEEWVAAEVDPKTGKILKPATVQHFRDGEAEGRPEINPLGEIPLVHVSNYPLSGEYYGISDIIDAVELNRELNEKTTDISDIINYHASPVTVITGGKLKDLERGANRIWSLPEGATATNLGLDGDLAASQTHWKQLKEALLEMAGVPEIALGKFQAVSNTTGVALAIQYLPLVEKRNIKVLTYGLGFRLCNRLIMKINQLKDAGFSKKMDALKGNKYRNEVVFPDPLPMDEAAELEMSRARLDMGLTHRRRELERMGVGRAEAEAILQKAMDEQEVEAERMFDTGPGPGENQNSRGGNRATQGSKTSDTVGRQRNGAT